jgi:hypothetical protein
VVKDEGQRQANLQRLIKQLVVSEMRGLKRKLND